MANPEHLKILKQGVEVWNQWREENPDVEPALSDPNLRSAHLEYAHFRGVDLRGGHFENADLWGASLRGIDFRHVDLRHADLRRADLKAVNFEGVNLESADFTHSILSNACFVNARLVDAHLVDALLQSVDLDGADLRGVHLWGTAIGDVDLSHTKGLGEIWHHGRSSIGTSTLERTAEGIARDGTRQRQIEAFFQGAGVEDHWIDYFRSRVDQPMEYYSCFISYSHQDQGLARRLYVDLQDRGIRCWLDEKDMKPGDRILGVVSEAIRLHDKILLCCSEASLESWWVKDEIRKAMERERRHGRDIIIPLMVDRYLLDGWEDGLAADLRSRLAADFTGWEHDNAKFEEQFERVVRALRTEQKRGQASSG